MTRWIAGAMVTSGLLFLNGCGSEPPPPRSFKAEISNVESAMSNGDGLARNNSHEDALNRYRAGMEIIRKAKLDAEGSELARLKTLEEDLRAKIRNSEVRKLTVAVAPATKAPVAQGEDLAAKQLREEAEAKKKADAANAKERKKAEDLLKAAEAPKVKAGKQEEESEAATAATGKGGEAAKKGEEAAADGVPADAKIIISKAQGPYPAVTDKSPDVEISKMEIRGNSIIAYVQVYNRSNDGMRIDTQPAVFFKDANSNVMIQPQAVACFLYNGFKADAKDPMEQGVAVITTGSHSIDGNAAFQFVAVGQNPNASKCQSVSVKVLLGGKSFLGNGPTRPVAGGGAKEPGATNLGGVNFK